jgi:3-deoxy-D-manno-octulosonate 8-phosphate phosphatase (KDO 8-P phosphatase)
LLEVRLRKKETSLAKSKKKIAREIIKRAKQIQVLLMDVDGTITKGGVYLLSQADGTVLEMKVFDAHDGQGISLARTAGIRTGFITGRESSALRHRARELGVEFVFEKQPHKIAAYEEILRKTGVPESAVAFLGDDLPDLTVMHRVGFAVAVADSAQEVLDAAHYVCRAKGGEGAARETVELILKSKGIWKEMIDKARA